MALTSISSIGALLVATIATVTDVRTGKIYNWLTLPAIPIGLVVRAVDWAMAKPDNPVGNAIAGAGNGFLGFLLGLVCIGIFKMTIMRKFGGGDVKLFAALGAFVGPAMVFGTFLYYCVAFGFYTCGVMALAFPWHQLYLAWAGKDMNLLDLEKFNKVRKAPLPVAPFIALGLLLACIFEKQTMQLMGLQ